MLPYENERYFKQKFISHISEKAFLFPRFRILP